MVQQQDYVALDWVKSEIDETLTQARHSLETYVENIEDMAQLRFCLAYIHQISGSLQVVELYGAALLCEEMELFCSDIISGAISPSDDNMSLLMQGILQLSPYLDQVKSARKDVPAILRPLVNNYRKARGENRLTDSAFFNPDVNKLYSRLPSLDYRKFDDPKFIELLRKLRQMYQFAMIGLFRGDDLDKNYEYCQNVFDRLFQVTRGTPAGQGLYIASAFVEGLANGSIHLTTTTKKLLKDLDDELKRMSSGLSSALKQKTDEHLLKSILYHISESETDTGKIHNLKKTLDLEKSAPSNQIEQIAAPDKETLDSVVSVLVEELGQIKDSLDIMVRGNVHELQSLASLVPSIKHISDTMAMVGLAVPRKVLQEQINNINAFIESDQAPSDSDMMDIAGALLYVEASLSGIGHSEDNERPKLNDAHEAVIAAARNGLEQTKEAITDFIGSHFDLKYLKQIPAQLNSISGGLHMIHQDKAARIILSSVRYVNQKLIADGHTPAWTELDTLADALMGVEYYLERLGQDGSSASEKWLEQSQNSVAQLGFPVDEMGTVFSENLDEKPIAAMSQEDALADSPEIVLGNAEPIDQGESTSEPDTIETIKADTVEAELVENSSIQTAALMSQNSAGVTSEDTVTDDELIDDEIIGIFLEEVEEVLEEINTYYPRYAANEEDIESLGECRRAFHTLKGSGRMVGATVIGELAWAVESMLNRLIDRTIKSSPAILEVVSDVTALIPALIEDFKQQAQVETDRVTYLTSKANDISKNEWDGAEFVEDQTESTLEMVEILDENDSEAESDGSLISIFKSEMEIHLSVVESRLNIDFDQEKAVKIRDSLQRALHTIQGSAQAANFEALAETAFASESMVKDFQGKGILLDQEVADCLMQFVSYVRAHLESLHDNGSAEVSDQSCREAIQKVHKERIEQLQSGEDEPDVMELFMSANMDIILDAESIVSSWPEKGHSIDDILLINKGLHELAISAERVNLRPIARLSDRLVEFYNAIFLNKDESEVGPGCYQLALTAHEQLINMIDRLAAGQSIKFATQIEAELEQKQNNRGVEINESPFEGGDHFVSQMLAENLDTKDIEPNDETGNSAQENQLSKIVAQHLDNVEDSQIPVSIQYIEVQGDAELIEIFVDEAQDIIEQITTELDRWKSDPGETEIVASLQRHLHTLKGGARMAEISPMADLSHEMENLYESMNEGVIPIHDEVFELCHQCHDQLNDMVQEVLSNGRCPEASQWTSKIQSYLHWAKDEKYGVNQKDSVAPIVEQIIPSATFDEEPEELPTATFDVEDKIVDIEPVTEKNLAEGSPWRVDLDEDMDLDILDIFIDEAAELLHELDSNIHLWQDEPFNEEYSDALKRILHTLKGGARLAKLQHLAKTSHDFETYVVKSLREHPTPEDDFFTNIIARYDDLANGIEYLQQLLEIEGQESGVGASVIAQVEPTTETNTSEQSQDSSSDANAKQSENNNVLPFAKKGTKQGVKARGHQPQETVKVGATLLENLVNLAGETSITRSRLEEQVSDFGFTLVEMESTIDRLRDQVRRLDIETEAQVAFRQEKAEETNYQDFDPLEMDRYSAIQQLSKSLTEATSDLFDLKSSLTDKTRDAETVLLQQSRINTELHEGLMQTRMVPFSRLVPRLRRIVRQIADETAKSVDLSVNQAEGELDRSVLERMISPLEHILRNAVDHGIEQPETREANGKSKTGRIEITVSRQGGEAIIQIADDGAGINLTKVRAKAIEKGLITADQDVSDQQVVQFILDAGFTTTDTITQISGRGVGMDVVQSEVRALGGLISIETDEGLGTRFTIRLSVNVSVSRALMVRLGEDQYAIPLDSIEGIVRISPSDLDKLLKKGTQTYEYAGKHYSVSYLGDLLSNSHRPVYMNSSLPVPLVLVKNPQGTEAIALHVDSLQGSKEIVVKSLGPQFNDVKALSGATILGDGSVVVILDLAAMVRSDLLIEARTGTHDAISSISSMNEEHVPRVLIVDDSVTVRKVTSRLLDRNGFEAKTAKDGADAITILQDYTPDVILLDIEMPRMDGFEVASRVRHDPRTQHIPIIMITSRTGTKHRERAIGIGVDDYMGKPYQEGILLEKINTFVASGRKNIT